MLSLLMWLVGEKLNPDAAGPCHVQSPVQKHPGQVGLGESSPGGPVGYNRRKNTTRGLPDTAHPTGMPMGLECTRKRLVEK